MKRIISGIFIVVLAATFGVGCSKYNKLLNSKDFNKMFTEGLKLYDKKKYQQSAQLFEEASQYFIGTVREDSCAYYLAASNYKLGYFDTSSELLSEFRRRYGRSPFLEDAEYMYAMGYYFSSPRPYRDQTYTVRAINAIDEYMGRYPKSEKKDLLDERRAEMMSKLFDKTYLNAYTYYKIGKYKSAVTALKNAIAKYPESPYYEELLYLAAKSSYMLASKSIERKQLDRYMSAMDDYYTFISEYPDSKYRKELDQMQERSKRFVTRKGKNAESEKQ